MTRLGPNRYGKSGIRLVTVTRDGSRHILSDLTIDVWLEGNFGPAFVDADNSPVLPTDTLRGTVYAFARQEPPIPMEEFALRLARHFLGQVPPAELAEVTIAAATWDRVGGNHPHAFTRGSPIRPTVTVRVTGDTTQVSGGIADLVVLKSTRSGFCGFMIDEYTTLAETDDRILATSVTGRWDVRPAAIDRGDLDWPALSSRVQQSLIDAFAGHDSQSVQHTLYAMGEAVLAACEELAAVWLSMPNLHHLLVDLSPYGLDNPNEVFVATDRPYGAIEATVVADDDDQR